MKTDPMKKEWRKELRQLTKDRRTLDRALNRARKQDSTAMRIILQCAQRRARAHQKDTKRITTRIQVLEGRLS